MSDAGCFASGAVSAIFLSCKFWIQTIGLARNLGISAKELRYIEKIIIENHQHLLEAWDEHFGD
jgi:hypothetical protein